MRPTSRSKVAPPLDESIELIHRSGLRLKETLESILTLAELESGSVSLEPDMLDLRAVVRSTAEIFAGQARRKGIDFSVTVPDDPVEAVIDATAVSQIVMNLVSNAVKFTDSGGVTVRVFERRTHGVIEVRDTGIGIRDDFLPHIFDEFVQESEGLDREYEGSGLGLTIVRQLTEMHHGSIDVDSRAGHGTCFTVELPSESIERAD